MKYKVTYLSVIEIDADSPEDAIKNILDSTLLKINQIQSVNKSK